MTLAQAVTRISDRSDPVSDEIWNEACKLHDELGLSLLLISIASINVWNRVNVSTRQIAGNGKSDVFLQPFFLLWAI